MLANIKQPVNRFLLMALFQFAVKTTFSNINYGQQMVSLVGPIFLKIKGQDIASGVQMELGLVPVHVQHGTGVSPCLSSRFHLRARQGRQGH